MSTLAATTLELPAVCPLDCADTCSLNIELSDGKVSKVRGNDNNPFTRGKICAKVATALPEQVHGTDRLLQPMRRIGKKGPGAQFKAISWNDALDEIHTRFTQDINEHGPASIVPLNYGGPMGMLAGGSMDARFFNQLGARRVNSSTLCAGVADAAYGSLFGDAGGIPHAEFEHSKLIVIWGNNVTACNLHLTKIIRNAQKNGAKLVVIDPKRIRIAEQADLHLAIMPGTDVVLAYAVAAELKRQGGLDDDFIAKHVLGAEAYLQEAESFTLDKAAEICGVAAEDIKQFASFWKDIKPAAINIGIGPERNRNGGSGIRAALALPVLSGNFGPLGAGVCNVSSFFPTDSSKLERDDLYQGEDNEISVLDIPKLILEKETHANSTPIRSLFIYNHNPIAVHPEQAKMQEALNSEELFIVGCDLTMTDSMNYADILLPATSHLEYADIYQAYGHPVLQESASVMEPLGKSLPNTEIFRRLAARFSFTDPLFSESDQELIELAIDYSHPNMQGRERAQLSPSQPMDCTLLSNGELGPSLFRGQSPDTPSGKIELFDKALEQECGMGLPKWTTLTKTHPFILVSPSSEKRTNSTFGNVPGHDSDVVLEMHPEDATELKLEDKQIVKVFNEQATVQLAMKLSSAIKRGTVYCPKGAWLKQQDHTINALLPGHRSDIAGGACYNDAQVSVEAL